MVDDSSANQQVVLMIVGGVGKSSEVVIELNDSHREMGTYRYINAAAHASGKLMGPIRNPRRAAPGVRCSQQNLRERLGFMIPLKPRLRNSVTCPRQERCEGYRFTNERCAAGGLGADIQNGRPW